MDSLVLFASAFLVGVAGAVYVLVRGVERSDRPAGGATVDEYGREHPSSRIALSIPFAAAALALFGLLGYSLARWTALGRVASTLFAGVLALAAATVITVFVGRWARRAAQLDVPDERYVLQGHVARVVALPTAGGEARVEYESNGRRVLAIARSLGDAELTLGADVAIDHVEDGVVYVEPWSSVEERL